MNLFKKLYYRIIKGVELYGNKNIKLNKSTKLCNYSVVNASNGSVILGNNVRIGNGSELVSSSSSEIHIKDYSSMYSNCTILGDVLIERYCLLSANIYMSSGNHLAFRQPELLIKVQDTQFSNERKNKKIHIHEDVWIGYNVFIAPGVTVGRGAVIGGGAYVTKDVSPYDVVVGTPAKVLKKRLEFNPPYSLDAGKIQDLPYFYKGFDHMLASKEKQTNGMKLIDEGELYLNKEVKSVKVIGKTNQDSVISFKNEEQIFDFNIKEGLFELEINNLKVTPQKEYLILSVFLKNSDYNREVRINKIYKNEINN